MFEKFSEVTDGKEETDSCLQNEVISHLQNLYQEYSRYFPDLEVRYMSFVRNPFNVEPDIIPGFSALLQIKTKTRNRLGVEHDMRCALSTTVPKIYTLVLKKQVQPSL